jgi:hypothetical protein
MKKILYIFGFGKIDETDTPTGTTDEPFQFGTESDSGPTPVFSNQPTSFIRNECT